METVDERFFITTVRDAVRIRLRIVANVAGANPIKEKPVEVVAQEFLEEREFVLANFGKGETELRAINFSIAFAPSKLRVFFGKFALQTPAVIVFVDADPCVNFQPDFVTLANRARQAVEVLVIKRFKFVDQRGPLFGCHSGSETL